MAGPKRVTGTDLAERRAPFSSAIPNSFTLLAVVPCLGPLPAFIAYVVIAVTISGGAPKQGKHDELTGGTQVVKG